MLVVDPDKGGELRAFDPELWMAPDGKLRLVWAQGIKHSGPGVWLMETSEAEADRPTWSEPKRVTDGVMMCKPLVLSSGEWVLPVAAWFKDDGARMIASSDQGQTWTLRGACNVPSELRSADEHMFVERKDGSLWLLVRTDYGIGQSVSTDRGVTWPELTPSAIAHATARFFIRIIYDFSRTGARHILMATFREEDAAAAEAVSDSVRLRQLVSEASGGLEKTNP